MSKSSSKPSLFNTYSVAHTAKCKLSMAADAPDRNLRFVLGHAFTLDKILLRVAEIEDLSDVEPQVARDVLGDDGDEITVGGARQKGQSGSLIRGRVKFDDSSSSEDEQGAKAKKKVRPQPPTTMPPPRNELDAEHEDVAVTPTTPLTTTTTTAEVNDEEDDNDDGGKPVTSDVDSDEGDGSLGLTRFASASAAPPRLVPSKEGDEAEEDEDEGEPITPPSLPQDFDYHKLMENEEDEQLGELYELVRSCDCQSEKGVKSQAIWDVKTPDATAGDKPNKRMVVMKVEA